MAKTCSECRAKREYVAPGSYQESVILCREHAAKDELVAALKRIASSEPHIRQNHDAVQITDEALNCANRAQIQQIIARQALKAAGVE